MIVLHEHCIDAGVGELPRLPGLHEKPARVAEHLRLDDDYTGDRRRD